MPQTSPEYLAYEPERLYQEYWEDYYEANPAEAVALTAGEEVIFKTGDPVVDKWEEQFARGEVPDLDADLTPEDRAVIDALTAAEQTESIADDYTVAPSPGTPGPSTGASPDIAAKE